MTARTLTFQVFRHNPRAPDSVPGLRDYRLEETPGMTCSSR